ncbi:PQQ-binding-like beta-propeller repeat protein [Actinoplanes sp. NPDC023801]|uniref:PQQ-binding-like beta-propeller repeat protein n=1 Tax=Actinoplanes sp. NPDC023801 TaxID=3154595 RepID=UPI0033E9F038
MRDVLIDLGEVPSGEPEPASPRAPFPYRWILGPLTLVLAVLLGGGGPWPQPPPEPVVLPLTLNDGIRIDNDRLYVIGPADPLGRVVRDHLVRVYELPGLILLNTYRVTVPGDIHLLSDLGDGLLLISYSDVQTGAPGTAVMRPGDAPVWDRPVSLYGVAPDRGVLLVHEGHEDAVEGRPGRSVWHGLDPRTGAVRWSVEQPERGQVAMPVETFWSGFPERIYTMRGDGLIEARSTSTGAVITSARLTGPPRDDTELWAIGGLLMVGQGTTETVAYDQVTLAERWRRPGPVVPEEGYPHDCRPTICIASYGGGGFSAVDPADGRRLWHVDGYDSSEVIDGHVLVASASQAEPVLALLDPVTGRVVTRITGWVSGGSGPAPGTAWVHHVAQPGYHLRYGVLDLTDGRVRLLGRAERIAGGCQFGTTVLVCRRLDSSVAVWRL